jgi:hypothetical protein
MAIILSPLWGLKNFWFIISVGLHPRLKTIALFEGFIEKSVF